MQGFIIENAQVYDPIANRIQKRPIAFQNGRFISPEKAENFTVIQGEGCLLTPGLIDAHVHYFYLGTENSVNPDSCAFPSGVTTGVDAGTLM